jgi:hypothetical protein
LLRLFSFIFPLLWNDVIQRVLAISKRTIMYLTSAG